MFYFSLDNHNPTRFPRHSPHTPSPITHAQPVMASTLAKNHYCNPRFPPHLYPLHTNTATTVAVATTTAAAITTANIAVTAATLTRPASNVYKVIAQPMIRAAAMTTAEFGRAKSAPDFRLQHSTHSGHSLHVAK